MVVLLVIISFGVFALLYLAPGSTEQVLLGTRPATPETRQAIREEFHLNDSFLEQYWLWVKGAARLDFGRSIRTSEPVLDGIKNRMGVTVFLGAYGFILAMLLGVPLGVLAALKRATATDRTIVSMSVFGVSSPAFATGIFLLYV